MADERGPSDGAAPPARPAAFSDETRALARELAELARHAPGKLTSRIAELSVRQQAELALRLPAKQRLELLLHAPKPMRLVRALPDADLYLTAREIGPSDALPLIALASRAQLQHLIDLESWRRDRFDAKRAGGWVALFLEAGEPSLRRFLRGSDDESLALLIQKWMRLSEITYEDGADVHGHGEGDAGTDEGFLTPDGNHRVSPAIAEHAPAVRRILQMFFAEDRERYQRVLWDALWTVPSELEEQALTWRNSRLEEHGFPPWQEALAVYGAPEGLTELPSPPVPDDPDGLAASRQPLTVLPQDRLVPAIESLEASIRERVLHELVSVANHLLVADGADLGDPAAHRSVIRKAGGYVQIGLEARGAVDPAAKARLLDTVPAIELFREGFARAATLQQRARQLTRRGWASEPRALELLDPPILARLEALRETRPLFVELDAEAHAARAREFATLAEIEETRVSLEMAELLGELLVERLGLDVPRLLRLGHERGAGTPRFGTLLLTLLAWHATRNELRGEPLPQAIVADFLRNVASRRTAPPDAAARALERLLQRVSTDFALDPRQASVLAAFGRSCLEQLLAECGSMDPGVPVNSRYIASLLVES